MRLRILEQGHTRKQKALLWLARRYINPVPAAILMLSYRPGLFGKHMAACLQEAMRRATCFSAAETELMCAFVSHQNRCEY